MPVVRLVDAVAMLLLPPTTDNSDKVAACPLTARRCNSLYSQPLRWSSRAQRWTYTRMRVRRAATAHSNGWIRRNILKGSERPEQWGHKKSTGGSGIRKQGNEAPQMNTRSEDHVTLARQAEQRDYNRSDEACQSRRSTLYVLAMTGSAQ